MLYNNKPHKNVLLKNDFNMLLPESLKAFYPSSFYF